MLNMYAIASDVNGAAGRATVVFNWLQDNADLELSFEGGYEGREFRDGRGA